MSIKHWPEGERPREKLLQRGADALSDAELLAILLRTGTQGMSAVDLARSLLQHYGGLSGVMRATRAELSQHKGMGVAAFAQFAAVLEIGRRVLGEELRQTTAFDSPQVLAQYLRLHLGHEHEEVALALFLDAGGHLIANEELARGSLNATTFEPRSLVRHALLHNATGIVLAHNHPSGNPAPSAADIACTQQIQSLLGYLNIVLIDHFIITQAHAQSMRQLGLLTPFQAA